VTTILKKILYIGIKMKYCGIHPTEYIQDVKENYKIIMKEIIKDPNKWRYRP
jgi:hypothetical protein